ncbi:MAG: hypothetical protein K6E76_00555 [Patescibacteria group bacterium]|nr:hypothetical protein [Patescibacteria group bacterium]
MVCNLRHSSEEMTAVYERKDNWISTLSMQRSKGQTAPLYSHETGWNRTIDNTP